MNYPADADGDALRRVAAGGNDMSRPMDIDFAVEVPDESTALRVAEVVAGHGYTPKVCQDEEDGSWTVPVHSAHARNVRIPRSAGSATGARRLNRPFGGVSDGWGTFGNAE